MNNSYFDSIPDIDSISTITLENNNTREITYFHNTSYALIINDFLTNYMIEGVGGPGGISYPFVYGTSVSGFGEDRMIICYSENNDSLFGTCVYPSFTTEIEDINKIKNNLKIYPNPTSQELTIGNNKLIINEITIIDITGKNIKTIKQNTNTINVADLPSGIYFIRLITDYETITKKLVKQ